MAKKPSIPCGIEFSMSECGEAEWIQQRKKKYRIDNTEEYIINEAYFPPNFVVWVDYK